MTSLILHPVHLDSPCLRGISVGIMPQAPWSLQSDFRGTRDGISQPRSLRGLALSRDGGTVYCGFIQGTTSAALRQITSAPIAGVITNHSPLIQAQASILKQAKGVATDDRGYVYATLNPFVSSTVLHFGIYSSDLATRVALATSNGPGASQLSGISVQKLGGLYYAYVAHNRGAATIERWNVTNVAAPVLDTTWANTGVLDLAAYAVGAYCNGLEAAADGTLYAAGGVEDDTLGDALFKIAPDGSRIQYVPVEGAMDVALFQDKVYVTQYLSVFSGISILNQSDLTAAGNLATGFPHAYADDDSGYSGIDIDSGGRLFVADQIYQLDPPDRTHYDRILVSS